MSTANSLELGMLALINDERAEVGLEPLRLITLLNEAAQDHSSWMLEADQFSHTGEDGTSPSDRMEQAGYPFEGTSLALENIGWQSTRGEEGVVDDVAQIHASLMNSEGHRENILSPDAEDIGIGIEVGTFSTDNGDYEAVMVTQVFGTTQADISAWVDPETGDDAPEIADDIVAENDTDTPEAEDDTGVPDDVFEEPTDPDDDTDPVVAEDVPEADTSNPDTDAETPVDEEEKAEDAPIDDVPEDDPSEDVTDPEETDEDGDDIPSDLPEVIAIEDAPPVAPFTLSIDLTDVFEIKRDGEQITLETTEDKLIAAFMNAFDDWAFLNEMPDETVDVSDLMLDGLAEDGLTNDLLEDDAEDIATMCI